MHLKPFLKKTTRDVLVMGRANVDMYVRNPSESLQEAMLFEKSVGGSAANIAVGLSRLGRRVDLLSRVSQDPFGDYVLQFLESRGVSTTFVHKDGLGSRTSLAFAERKKDDSQVLFYRKGASDLMVDIADVPIEELHKTAILVSTGTALSASPSREATLFAMEAALQAGTKTFLDLDWRPSAWDSAHQAGLFYRLAAAHANILIGTHEEMKILQHDRIFDETTLLAELFDNTVTELIVIKQGPRGSLAYTPDGSSWKAGIYSVDVKKNYGAGDAFAAAFMHGLLDGLEPDAAMRWGAGAAAMVVADNACAASAPTMEALLNFIATKKEHV